MIIQVGHSLGCPTFFCVFLPCGGRKSTSQQVNESTSLQVGESMGRCRIGRISPIRPMLTNAKAPLRQKFAPFAAYTNHDIKWM